MEKKKAENCEICMYYSYDYDYEDYVCDMEYEMDEDDTARLYESEKEFSCPFFRPGDEYTIVKKQM